MSVPSIPPSVLSAATIARAGGATRILSRLLAAGVHPVKTGVMASPITITKGADSAVSTLTGSSVGFASSTGVASATIQATDPRMTAIRGTWTVSGNSGRIGDGVSRGTGVRSGINGQGFAFCMSGTAFDVSLVGGTNSGNDSKMNVRVTHLTTGVRELINASDFLVSNTAAAAYYLVSGLAAGPKIIEVFFGRRVFVRGFNVAPTDTIWKVPVRSGLNCAALGDSYIDGPTSDTLCGGYVWHLAEALGIENIRPLGISQSGWVAAPSGASWLYRIQNGDLDVSRVGNLDVLFIYGSINDNAQTDATVQAAMASGLALIKEKQPNALVIHAGPQFTSSGQTSQSRYDAMKATFETVYPVGSRGVWIDNSPSGAPWMTGLGDMGATTGSGNNDLYLDTDKTHWNAAGHKYGGHRFGSAVIEAVRGMPY